MAGDWIPLYVDTVDKPELVTISSRLSVTRFCAIGYVVVLWCYFSRHTSTGYIPNLTLQQLCEVVGGTEDFWAELIEVGWLEERDGGLQLPNCQWITKSGKARMQATRRVQAFRASGRGTRNDSVTPDRYKNVTREEKRRVYRKKPPNPLLQVATTDTKPDAADATQNNQEPIPAREPVTTSKKPAVSYEVPAGIPSHLDTPGVREALREYLAERKARKFGGMTAVAWSRTFSRFQQAGSAEFVAAVHLATASGWKGIFVDKPQGGGTDRAALSPGLVHSETLEKGW